jgi:ribonuclease P protein component
MNALAAPPVKGRSSARFPRSARLLLSRDFKKVFDQGTHVVGRFMVMWLGEAGSAADLRMGVIASKRTFRRAVDRNRAKRLLRESFRLNRSQVDCGGDLVLIARHRILRAECPAVEKEFMWLLRKVGLVEKPVLEQKANDTEVRR